MKSTIHEYQKNNLKIVSENLKNIGLTLGLALTLFSCTPNDPTDPNGNPNGGNDKYELLSIRSTNLPSGNSCNKWDLNTSLASAPGAFTNLRPLDFITSPAGLLGQTTMSYNTSAWDKINKKYAVAINESLTIYDLSSSSVPTPTTYITNTKSLEYVAGSLYALKNDEIKVNVGSSFNSLTTPAIISTSGGVHVSNMATDGSSLFIIVDNKLYNYATSGLLLNSTTLTSDSYDGVEYNPADNKIYAIKKHIYPAVNDELVRITTAGDVTITSLSYTTDYSKPTTALDYATGTYIIFTSNGHGSDSHSITKATNLTTTPTVTTITAIGAQYVFGLQLKD
jgi:hypothetical protein